MKTTFNRDPEKLVFFMNQVWAHLDDHMADYSSDRAMVLTVTANLEGEAAEWVTQLQPELQNNI